jgi:hypothetical protein
MEKFKHISQLKIKRQQLHKRQGELEKLIRYDWKDIKSTCLSDTVSYGKFVLLNKVTETVKNYFTKKE